MDGFLPVVWFFLIASLWIGFFFLEGFDFGVGMLLPFLGKNDDERRAIINTIGPVWDANEVWLIVVGLILHGISFEYRSKDARPEWRDRFDWMIATGSFLDSFLFGIIFSNFSKSQNEECRPAPLFSGIL